jgi:hypothetical protein
MFRTWVIPYCVAIAILAPLILVANAPAWGWGAMWTILAAVIASTFLLHLWMESRENAKRQAHSGHGRPSGTS